MAGLLSPSLGSEARLDTGEEGLSSLRLEPGSCCTGACFTPSDRDVKVLFKWADDIVVLSDIRFGEALVEYGRYRWVEAFT